MVWGKSFFPKTRVSFYPGHSEPIWPQELHVAVCHHGAWLCLSSKHQGWLTDQIDKDFGPCAPLLSPFDTVSIDTLLAKSSFHFLVRHTNQRWTAFSWTHSWSSPPFSQLSVSPVSASGVRSQCHTLSQWFCLHCFPRTPGSATLSHLPYVSHSQDFM